MGILDQILDWTADAVIWVVKTSFVAIDYVVDKIARHIVGPPSGKIRAELRQQWLDLAPGEKDIPGVEWEGEIYYETPK